MNLKAWALVKGDGTLLKSFGVSASARTSAGKYTITFTTATGSDYVGRVQVLGGAIGFRPQGYVAGRTAAVASVEIESVNGGDANTDGTALWEFYE